MLPAIVFTALVLGTAVAMTVMGTLFGPSNPSPVKQETYECGVDPMVPTARMRVHIPFYLVAVLFIIFDIEVLYLIPWAVVHQSVGRAGLMGAWVFIGVLGFGLFYVWKRGALTWE